MSQQSGWQASVAALQQQLPLLHHLPDNSTASALLGAVLVLMLIPKLRILVWNTIETVLASLLLVVLVLVVLGLAPGVHCRFTQCVWHTLQHMQYCIMPCMQG
jgi:hypothetical protein